MKGGAYTYYHIIIFITLIIGILYIHANLDKYTPTDTLYNVPFHIRSSSADAPKSVSGVPLVIYQSWHSNQVPLKMQDTIYSLLKMNPEFDYYLYSDDKSREFIKENFDKEVVNAFDSLKPGAYKSDLWRCCILYKMGGIYLDIKYSSVVPLINVIRENPVIFTKDLNYNCSTFLNFEVRTGIYNAFMVSPPNNSIFKESIDEIVISCKNKSYGNNAHDITGPCHLSRIIEKVDPSFDVYKLPVYHGYEGILPYWIILKPPYVYYRGEKILKGYIEYRKEQSLFSKKQHYNWLWMKGDIYN
jgi:mannosyltransferase OCH1-like enzyme